VTDLSQWLLAHHGGLRGLFRLDVAELARIRELGDAKAVRVKAALELGRRLAALLPQPLVRFQCADVAPASGGSVASCARSCSRKTLALRACRADPLSDRTRLRGARLRRKSEVFRDAVRQQATAIVAVHNHPSGDPTPSAADVALTVEIVAAGQLLDIELLDHLIIGQGRWLSLKRLGLGFAKS
jgi:DNA repair protein RadC